MSLASYLINDRMRAIRKVTIPAATAKIPKRAGKPCTDPLKLTAHESSDVPALTPKLPFHFDPSDTSPMASSMAEERKSLRPRMLAIVNREQEVANSSNCLCCALKVNYLVT